MHWSFQLRIYYKGLYKPQSTIDFFTYVATASLIPILIYNCPGGASGIDIDSDTIIELSKHPDIVDWQAYLWQYRKS